MDRKDIYEAKLKESIFFFETIVMIPLHDNWIITSMRT